LGFLAKAPERRRTGSQKDRRKAVFKWRLSSK
jgi:hypothetical protein